MLQMPTEIKEHLPPLEPHSLHMAVVVVLVLV
jgi:hypothetical protein